MTLYHYWPSSAKVFKQNSLICPWSLLIDAVLHALNDAITPAAYWVLEFLDTKDDLHQVTGEIVIADKVYTFQERVGTPFVALQNISSQFETHDIVSALAIFDPRNIPTADSFQFPTYGKKSTDVLLNHYRKDKFALTLNGEETVETAVISPEVHTEWITFRTLLAKKPEDSIALQLKASITNEVLVTMLPNLHKMPQLV